VNGGCQTRRASKSFWLVEVLGDADFDLIARWKPQRRWDPTDSLAWLSSDPAFRQSPIPAMSSIRRD
jgi:hypothetical protein